MYNRFQMEENAMFQILIAEDDKNTRKLMEAVLKCNGFNPIPASSGEEALSLIHISGRLLSGRILTS